MILEGVGLERRRKEKRRQNRGQNRRDDRIKLDTKRETVFST